MKKYIAIIFSVLTLQSLSYACLDCTGGISGNVVITGAVTTSSITAYGTIASTTGFVGDGSGLYNLSTGTLASQVQVNSTVTAMISAINSTYTLVNGQVYSTYTALNSRFDNVASATESLRSNLSNIVSSNVVAGTFISSGSQTVDGHHIKSTTVTAGQYTNANISIDQDGRILEAANGTAGGSSASTSSAIMNLIITTSAADTNTYVFTASNIDIMGFNVVNFATAAAMNKTGPGGTDGIVGDPTFTWVKFWAIANPSTCSVLITSGDITVPTLPTGYTKWRWIGGGYNDGSSNIQPIYKQGNYVRYKVRRTFLNGVNPPESGFGTAADMTAYYPPWATSIVIGLLATSSVNSTSVGIRLGDEVGDSSWVDSTYDHFLSDVVAGAANTRFGQQSILPVHGQQTLYYRSASACDNLRATIGGYVEVIQ